MIAVCKNIFRRLTVLLTLLSAAYIFFLSARDMYSCYLKNTSEHLTWALLAAAFILVCILFLFREWCLRMNDRQALCTAGLLFGLMAAVQLILIFTLFCDCLPWADSLSVINEAISMSCSDTPAISSAGTYFEMYGNNYFFTIFLSYFFRFFRFFGLTSYWIEGLFLNMFTMDLGVYFSLRTVYTLKGPQKTALAAAFCLLNPLLYVFLPFVYTNTISIPFLMGIFCMFLLMENTDDPRRRYIYAAIAGLLTAVGFWIRVTTLIPIIALLIFYLLRGSRISLRPLLLFFAVTAVLAGSCRLLVNSHVSEEIRSKNFPVTHWIMMGLGGDGGYYSPDEDFTYSFSEKSEKTNANLREIKVRAANLAAQGPSAVLDLMASKSKTTWASMNDGLYIETGRLQSYHLLQDYIYGDKDDLLLYYYQSYKVMIYGLCMIAVLWELFRKKTDWSYPFLLTLLGFYIFYLLWEANCRYGICLTLLLSMIALFGLDGLLEAVKEHRSRISVRKTAGICLILFVLAPALYSMCRHYPDYTQVPLTQKEQLVNTVTRTYHENIIGDIVSSNSILTQTFTADHPFNEIGIYCSYIGEETWNSDMLEDDLYQFRLMDTYGNVLADTSFPSEGEGKYYKLFGFETVVPSSSSEYTIEISRASDVSEDSSDRIGFIYLDFDSYDYVSDADLSVNHKSMNRDLVFMVEHNLNGAYTTPARYLAGCAAILCLLCVLTLLLLTERRPKGKFASSLFGTKLLQ